MKMQIKILIVLLLCIIVRVKAQASTVGQNCSADTLPENDDSHEGYFYVYSQGKYGRNAVERLRSKPESYYQNLFDNAIMFFCDVPNASERCVEEDSPLAARDKDGTCIKAADFECPTKLCERSSNCYWNTVKAGQNRTTRFKVDSYAKAADALYGTKNSYMRDIAEVGLIGIAISALLLISWILFFIGRYLCCCLWSRCASCCFTCSTVPRKEGYKTCQHIVIPGMFYLVTLVSIIAAGSLAFVGNEDISVALTNTFLHADGLGNDLSNFLARSSVPLRNLHAIVDEAAVDAKTIFDDDTEYIQDDARRTLNSFVSFFELHSSGLNETNAMQQFESVTKDFVEKITPITTNIQSMLDILKVGLTDQVDGIKGSIDNALDLLESFDQLIATGQSQLYEYEGKELAIRDVRRALVLTMFIVSILVTMMGFFGILVWKSRVCRCSSAAIKATGFLSALLGSVSLVAASVFLCSSFILHDACKTSDILVRDFEPPLGDQLAVGVNACFNDTNLVVAFNMSETLIFQQVLDDELKEIALVNVSEQFDMVIKPLSIVEILVAKMSDKALTAINKASSANQILCPFNDMYTEEAILAPWELTRDLSSTPYVMRNTFGQPASYNRLGEETSEVYLDRIYNIAGTCSAPTSCCIKVTSSRPDVCESNIYNPCDYGSNCAYPCETLRAGIVEGVTQFRQVRDKKLAMTADLGLSCPIDVVDGFDDTCPTQEFRSRYSNLTVLEQIYEYKDDIVATKDDLVAITTTSVGAAMSEVEDFICSMNGTFVERRYNQIKHDVCVTLQGGVAQVNWALWILGICLEVVAILAHVLVIRKGGRSEKEVAASKVLNTGGRRTYVPAANIYSRATV